MDPVSLLFFVVVTTFISKFPSLLVVFHSKDVLERLLKPKGDRHLNMSNFPTIDFLLSNSIKIDFKFPVLFSNLMCVFVTVSFLCQTGSSKSIFTVIFL